MTKQWIKTDWLIDQLEWGNLVKGLEPNDNLAIGRITFINGIKVEVFVHKRTPRELIDDALHGGAMHHQKIQVFVTPNEYSPTLKSNYDCMELELIVRRLKGIETSK